MNIYNILFWHYGPKDSENGSKILLIADSDESVYNWYKSDPKFKGESIYVSWGDYEKIIYDEEKQTFIDEYGDESEEYWEDEDGSPEDFKTRVIRNQGEIGEDFDEDTAYYGITQYGWELVKENISDEQMEFLIENNIAIRA